MLVHAPRSQILCQLVQESLRILSLLHLRGLQEFARMLLPVSLSQAQPEVGPSAWNTLLPC